MCTVRCTGWRAQIFFFSVRCPMCTRQPDRHCRLSGAPIMRFKKWPPARVRARARARDPLLLSFSGSLILWAITPHRRRSPSPAAVLSWWCFYSASLPLLPWCASLPPSLSLSAVKSPPCAWLQLKSLCQSFEIN
jgi:hypothetical protein